MDEETLVQGSIRPRAPQPVIINGYRYEFDPVSGSFTARPRIRVRTESTPTGRWITDWMEFDEMANNKSEDWYIPGGKE